MNSVRTLVLVLILTLLALPAAASAPKVLFDNCHAENVGNANWTYTGGFSDFATAFRNLGCEVFDITEGPVLYDTLKKFDIYVLGEPNSRLTDDEERALVQWVKDGGLLYLVGDHAGADRNNDGFDSVNIFNRFVKEFGFELIPAWAKRVDPIVVKEETPLLNSVKTLGLWGGTVLKVTNPTMAKGFVTVKFRDRDLGDVEGFYLVTSEVGKGRVVAMGDSSPYDDGTGDTPLALVHDGWNLVDHDSRQLARNTIAWLLGRDPKSAILPVAVRLGVDKLNVNPGAVLPVTWKLDVAAGVAATTAKVRYYLKKVKAENLLEETEISDLKAGLNEVVQNFQCEDNGLLRVYVTVEVPGIKETGCAFTTIRVGRIPRLCLDRTHQNDWTNRMRAFRNFLDDEGIFFSDSRKNLAQDISRPDINLLVVTAPKKGIQFADAAILPVIDFLKRDGVLILVGSPDKGKWGDAAGLKPLVDALNLPLAFNDDSVFINDPLKNSTLTPLLAGLPAPWGEMPCSLVARSGGQGKITWLADAPAGSTSEDGDGDGSVAVTGDIHVDARIDLSGTALGAGTVLMLGACPFSDWCFKEENGNQTREFINRVIRSSLPAEVVTPLSQILPSTPPEQGMCIIGAVKSFNGKTLVLVDGNTEISCSGNFPASFSPKPGVIVKLRGDLVRQANWFIFQVK